MLFILGPCSNVRYLGDSRANLTAKVDLLESCTVNVHSWSLHNGLQLNQS